MGWSPALAIGIILAIGSITLVLAGAVIHSKITKRMFLDFTKSRLYVFRRRSPARIIYPPSKGSILSRIGDRIINPLGLIGAIAGVGTLFLAWDFGGVGSCSGSTLEMINGFAAIFWYSFPLVFYIGTAIAFITPFGGLIQFAGSWGMIWIIIGFGNFQMSGVTLIPFGAIIGLVSSVLVVASIFVRANEVDGGKVLRLEGVTYTIRRTPRT